MLKLLTAELAMNDGEFTPRARDAVVAGPAPDAGGRGVEPGTDPDPRPLAEVRGPLRVARVRALRAHEWQHDRNDADLG
jgi:hypothetical protein